MAKMASPRTVTTTTRAKGKADRTLDKAKEKEKEIRRYAIAPGHYAKDCWDVVRAAQTGQVGAPKIKDKACSNRHSNLVSSRHSTELRALQVTALIPLYMFFPHIDVWGFCF